MTLLDLVVKEFLSMVELLEQEEPIVNDRIIIERQQFKKLLEKYLYLKFTDKVKIYKDLNFIIHDKNNFTMPYRDAEQKKTVRNVMLNYKTYQTLKHLYETPARL